MHSIIFQSFNKLKKGFIVDHKNNVKTDNRLSNLQQIKHRENSSKDKHRYNPTSKYVGVNKVGEKYRATISINNKKIHIGYFDSEIEASKAYQLKLKTI